jgi:hypothetical protein
MKRASLVAVLVLTACSRGNPEGAFLSNAIPMEVKKEGEKFAVKLNSDVLLMGQLDGHVISAKLNEKEVTVEYSDDWNKVTVRDGVLAREFTRVPEAELKTRIEQERVRLMEEKAKRQVDLDASKKQLAAAKQLLANGKYTEAKEAFEALATRAPEYETEQVQKGIRLSTSEMQEQQRLEVAQAQIDRGDLDSAEKTLLQVDPQTLQATRRGALMDKMKAAKGKPSKKK